MSNLKGISAPARKLIVAGTILAVLAPIAASAAPRGVDVSHHQGRIRWGRVARAGVDFAYIKATEGTDIRDPRFRENRKRAERSDILVGAYHFARPSGAVKNRIRKDARIEARNFLAVARPKKRHLVPVLDLETSGVLSRSELGRWTRTWVDHVSSEIGEEVVIYSSPTFWRDRMRGSTRFARAKHPLWLAHYTRKGPDTPALGWNNEGWTMWQYTDCGRVRGIRGCVDKNVFGGDSLRDLRLSRADARERSAAPKKRVPAHRRNPPSDGDVVDRIATLVLEVVDVATGLASRN